MFQLIVQGNLVGYYQQQQFVEVASCRNQQDATRIAEAYNFCNIPVPPSNQTPRQILEGYGPELTTANGKVTALKNLVRQNYAILTKANAMDVSGIASKFLNDSINI